MSTNTPAPQDSFPAADAPAKRTVSMSLPVVFSVTFGLVVVTALVAAGITTIAVKDDNASAAAAGTTTVTVREAPAYGTNPTTTTTTTAPDGGYKINQPVSMPNVVFTLKSATSPETVQIHSSDGYVTTAPKQNAKFILLQGEVENTGRSEVRSLYIVRPALWDSDYRLFRPMENFHSIQQNLDAAVNNEMPSNLQPGFSTTVHYLFEVPAKAAIEGASVEEDDDPRDEPWSMIVFPEKL